MKTSTICKGLQNYLMSPDLDAELMQGYDLIALIGGQLETGFRGRHGHRQGNTRGDQTIQI